MPSSYNRYVLSNSSPLKIILWCYGENREPDYCQNISLTPFWLPAKKQHYKRESEANMFLNYFALGVLISSFW